MERNRVPAVLLTALALLSLTAHLLASARGAESLVFLFKPLTTVLVITLAWTLGKSVAESDSGQASAATGALSPYARLVLAGLVWSLAGDLALLRPDDFFVYGLAAFLIAHLCYIGAFSRRARRLRPGVWSLPFALAYVLLVGPLAPHAGPLLGPVLVYGAVLLVMAWCATETWRVERTRAAALAALGAVSFVASDALLAFGRFVPGAPRSEAVVMTTYIAAQLLLAWSVTPSYRQEPTVKPSAQSPEPKALSPKP